MKDILEILKYILPSLVVFLTAFLVMKSYNDKEKAKRRFDLRINNQKLITPIRLQAYERMILFLERISPEILVVRVQKPNMRIKELQKALLSIIRTEYQHNLSQQIYITYDAWIAIKTAKDSIVKLIYTATSKQDPNALATNMSKIIIQMYASVKDNPTDNAIKILKEEVHDLIL